MIRSEKLFYLQAFLVPSPEIHILKICLTYILKTLHYKWRIFTNRLFDCQLVSLSSLLERSPSRCCSLPSLGWLDDVERTCVEVVGDLDSPVQGGVVAETAHGLVTTCRDVQDAAGAVQVIVDVLLRFSVDVPGLHCLMGAVMEEDPLYVRGRKSSLQTAHCRHSLYINVQPGLLVRHWGERRTKVTFTFLIFVVGVKQEKEKRSSICALNMKLHPVSMHAGNSCPGFANNMSVLAMTAC